MAEAPLLTVRDLNAWYGEGHALHGVQRKLDQHALVHPLAQVGGQHVGGVRPGIENRRHGFSL